MPRTEATTHRPTKGPRPAPAPMGTDVPYMEVKGSALGTDIERIGERILIFADRVELRDRGNSVRQVIRYDQLDDVEIEKRIMGPTLNVRGTEGSLIAAKALRPELASGAKAMIEKHAQRWRGGGADSPGPEPVPAGVGAGAASRASATDSQPAPAASEPPPAAPPAEPTPAVGPGPTTTATVEPTAPPRTHKHVLAGMVDELYAAGVLTAKERDEKHSLIELLDRAGG